MEFVSTGEIRAALSALATTIEADGEHADAVRETAEQIHARISAAWAGSRHDEAVAGIAHTATAVDRIDNGLSGLLRCVDLLRTAAARY